MTFCATSIRSPGSQGCCGVTGQLHRYGTFFDTMVSCLGRPPHGCGCDRKVVGWKRRVTMPGADRAKRLKRRLAATFHGIHPQPPSRNGSVMSSLPQEGSDGIVNISPSGEGRSCVEVDPKSAQSLIRFLLDKGIRLDPPEGGVARDPKYQMEMGGVPKMHAFHALASTEKLRELAAEWESNPTRPVS